MSSSESNREDHQRIEQTEYLLKRAYAYILCLRDIPKDRLSNWEPEFKAIEKHINNRLTRS